MRRDAIRNARVPGLKPFHVACAKCAVFMKESAKPVPFRVDHVIPASEPAALVHSWDDFFKRLNVPADLGLQILCEACHDVKTKTENSARTHKLRVRNKVSKKQSSRPRRSR